MSFSLSLDELIYGSVPEPASSPPVAIQQHDNVVDNVDNPVNRNSNKKRKRTSLFADDDYEEKEEDDEDENNQDNENNENDDGIQEKTTMNEDENNNKDKDKDKDKDKQPLELQQSGKMVAASARRLDLLYGASRRAESRLVVDAASKQQEEKTDNDNKEDDDGCFYYRPSAAAILEARRRREQERLNARSVLLGGRRRQSRNIVSQEVLEQDRKRRAAKWARIGEWNAMRDRWKRRKVDFRHEVDTGNAAYNALLLHPHIWQPKQPKQHSNENTENNKTLKLEQQKSRQEEQDEYADTSDEEQDAIQNQLLSSSQQAQKEIEDLARSRSGIDEKLATKKEEERLIFEPYENRLDYWEMGRSAPTRAQQPVHFARLSALTNHIHKKARKQAIPTVSENLQKEHDDSLVTFRAYKSEKHPYVMSWNKHYPMDSNIFASGRFVQRRHLLVTAARSLVGSSLHRHETASASSSSSSQQRWIRLLWNEDIAECSRSMIVRGQTREYGRNLACFLSHQWHPHYRLHVAQQLGLSTPQLQRYGRTTMHGSQLESNSFCKISKHLCDKLVQQFSVGPQVWSWTAETASSQDADSTVKEATTRTTKRKDTTWFPTDTLYHFLPGTVPPMPPISAADATAGGLLFGARDKHALVSHNATVDPDTILTVTVSSLLSRFASLLATATATLSTTRMSIDDQEDDDDDSTALSSSSWSIGNVGDAVQKQQLAKLWKQIQIVCARAIALNRSNLYKRLQKATNPVVELPLASFYKTVMIMCSLAAGGLPPKKLEDDDDNDNDKEEKANTLAAKKLSLTLGMDVDDIMESDHDDDDDDGNSVDAPAYEQTLERCLEVCEDLITHNGLLFFGRLRITCGLLCVARVLPASAIEILAQPLDHDKNRTPFDIIRMLLQHLEDAEYLVEDDNVSMRMSDPVHRSHVFVGELEDAFHRAAQAFAHCVERDPDEVEYQNWYIAALAASVLLCSGNHMGSKSKARCCPSAHVKSQNAAMWQAMGEKQAKGLAHEVRRMLPKFHEGRKELALAFQLLIRLAQHQEHGVRAHLSVSSFLEWRQVVALLIGPEPPATSPFFGQIRAMHQKHVLAWARHEESTRAHLYLQRLALDRERRLDALARQLETNPARKEHWCNLVRALGPVPPCADLTAAQNRESTTNWWGTGRCDWWDQHLLGCNEGHVSKPFTLSPVGKKKMWPILCKALDQAVKKPWPSLATENKDDANDNDSEGQTPPTASNQQWLEFILQQDEASISREPLPIETRSRAVNNFLPKSYQEILAQDAVWGEGRILAVEDESDTSECDYSIELNSDSSGAEALEIQCYKMVIVSHLYHVANAWVRYRAMELCLACWKKKTQVLDCNCNAFRALNWLSKMGIPLTRLIVYEKSKES